VEDAEKSTTVTLVVSHLTLGTELLEDDDLDEAVIGGVYGTVDGPATR